MIVDARKPIAAALIGLMMSSAAFAGNHTEGGTGFDNSGGASAAGADNSGGAGAAGDEASTMGRAVADEARSGDKTGTALAKALCGLVGAEDCESIGEDEEPEVESEE